MEYGLLSGGVMVAKVLAIPRFVYFGFNAVSWVFGVSIYESCLKCQISLEMMFLVRNTNKTKCLNSVNYKFT